MEIDPRPTDRLPFHGPDEAEQAHAGAIELSRDTQRRHLQRVPLFSGFNEDELRRVAELRLLIVDRSHFWRLLDETPDLIRRILTILSRRVRRLEQTVHAILHGTNPT
jgi:hypothetical protein